MSPQRNRPKSKSTLPRTCGTSKQRNKNLQTILIEAAKLAPRYNPPLAVVHERELKRGNRNRATLAVARKLVAYLMAVDKSGKPFEMRVSGQEAAA